jgi:hypothetical protein
VTEFCTLCRPRTALEAEPLRLRNGPGTSPVCVRAMGMARMLIHTSINETEIGLRRGKRVNVGGIRLLVV